MAVRIPPVKIEEATPEQGEALEKVKSALGRCPFSMALSGKLRTCSAPSESGCGRLRPGLQLSPAYVMLAWETPSHSTWASDVLSEDPRLHEQLHRSGPGQGSVRSVRLRHAIPDVRGSRSNTTAPPQARSAERTHQTRNRALGGSVGHQLLPREPLPTAEQTGIEPSPGEKRRSPERRKRAKEGQWRQ
jgi:hypothetical protein